MHCSSWICGVVDRRCLPCVCRRFQLGKEYDNVLCTSLEAAGSMAALRMAPRKGFMNRFRRKSPKLVSQPRTIPLQRNLVRLFVSRLNTSRLRWSLLAVLDTPYPSGTLNAPRPDLARGVRCGPPCMSSARVSSLVVPFRGEFRRSQLAATLGRRFLFSGELPLPSRGLASTTGSASLILQRSAPACK